MARLVSGFVLVAIGFVFGACLVSILVRVGFVYGACLVRVWCLSGSCLVWIVFGFVCLVSIWVHVGFVVGACLLSVWVRVWSGECLGSCRIRLWGVFGSCLASYI